MANTTPRESIERSCTRNEEACYFSLVPGVRVPNSESAMSQATAANEKFRVRVRPGASGGHLEGAHGDVTMGPCETSQWCPLSKSAVAQAGDQWAGVRASGGEAPNAALVRVASQCGNQLQHRQTTFARDVIKPLAALRVKGVQAL